MSGSALRSLTVAAKGKGAMNLARRARSIGGRYGIGPRRMDRRLESVLDVVERYGCRATLPITAAAVRRNPRTVTAFAERGIEFAVHGYRHVDHSSLGDADQVGQLGLARRILHDHGLRADGFRAPYLRWNGATLHALRVNGFRYDSSQAIHWPIDPAIENDGYARALRFYDALSAAEHPSLPRIEHGIVRIPCSIPDDEAAVDRLHLSHEEIAEVWLTVFRNSHARGELFTLAVHPERVDVCASAIGSVLDAARSAPLGVWIARLDEIERWWRRRAETEVAVHPGDDGWLRVDVRGPEGTVVIADGLDIPGARETSDGALLVDRPRFDVRAAVRPFIALHPASADRLRVFLREHGFIVDVADSPAGYARFLRRERFTAEDELPLLTELRNGRTPLLHVGRWPGGSRSALSVTGDVDALTIWDYASRFVGR